MLTRIGPTLAAAGLAALSLAGCDGAPLESLSPGTAPSAARGGAAMVEIYEARLSSVGGSGVTGTARFMVVDGRIKGWTHIQGLNPVSAEHMQHIHRNATCAPFGPVIVHLGPGFARPYPSANPAGIINFHEETEVAALEAMVGGPLDLENRVVVAHGLPGNFGVPVACGELERVR